MTNTLSPFIPEYTLSGFSPWTRIRPPPPPIPPSGNFGDKYCLKAQPEGVSNQVVRTSQVEAFGRTATFFMLGQNPQGTHVVSFKKLYLKRPDKTHNALKC